MVENLRRRLEEVESNELFCVWEYEVNNKLWDIGFRLRVSFNPLEQETYIKVVDVDGDSDWACKMMDYSTYAKLTAKSTDFDPDHLPLEVVINRNLFEDVGKYAEARALAAVGTTLDVYIFLLKNPSLSVSPDTFLEEFENIYIGRYLEWLEGSDE